MKKIKEFIQENYMFLLFYILLVAILTYPLPYYIYTGGGILSVNDKVIMNNKTESAGSYNLCYVKEEHATIPRYLLSFINKNWEVVPKEAVAYNTKETSEEMNIRDQIYLDQANGNAIIAAFKSSGKEYKILDINPVVLGYSDESVSNLKIGDEILSIDDIEVNSSKEIGNYINTKNIGDILNVKVINKEKEYDRTAKIVEIDNSKKIGMIIDDVITYETDPKIEFNFKNSEGGPSGGFMMSLALYDYLIDEDLSKGLKISGTGTIDIDGNIGTIGGVKYKLKGAVDKKSDIFFVPIGENYDEAIKEKEKHNYKIDVVGVRTLDDAIKYLESK